MRFPISNSVTALLAILILSGCGTDRTSGDSHSNELSPQDAAALQPQIMAFCGGCHSPPRPDSFPRDAWNHEIELAYRLFTESGRQDLTPPSMSDAVRWYRSQAPNELPLRKSIETPSPVQFQIQSVKLGDAQLETASASSPGISHLLPSGMGQTEAGKSILFCDMSRNGLFELVPEQSAIQVHQIAAARNPAHIEQTDLNGDGSLDYLLCEMGSFLPEDHDRGRLLWLTSTDGKDLVPHTLVEHVGRVVDARPADFDADGDLDVIVAVFGWRKTGQLLYLEQTSVVDGVPQFHSRQLDDRHGAIHVPVVDLDQDGDLDFLVLFSQEHESIEAFLNRGDGTFERQIVSLAGSPSYGSSGIELVDFDGDGDSDVLYTNGDTLDSSILKPYHSIQWLENTGDYPFQRHQIGRLPGAYRALPADLDSDGDLDVAAASWIPLDPEPKSSRADGTYATLVWYERSSGGSFDCHVLQSSTSSGYMTIAVDDVNSDGAPDIIAGRFETRATDDTPWIDIYRNAGRLGQ